MNTLGFQTALARLLVEPTLREQWRVAPDTVAGDLKLTAEETELLARIDLDRLDFTAGGIERARTRTLKRMFAATLRAVGDPPSAERLVVGFVRAVVPLAARDEPPNGSTRGNNSSIICVGSPSPGGCHRPWRSWLGWSGCGRTFDTTQTQLAQQSGRTCITSRQHRPAPRRCHSWPRTFAWPGSTLTCSR